MKISGCELQLLMTHGDGEEDFLEAKTNSSSLQFFNLL